MADQLATLADLTAALQLTSPVDTTIGTLWLECATAVVQAATGGQRIVQVVSDTATLIGTTDSWLDLPQIPVTAVQSVTLDGTALTLGTPGAASTTYRRHGNRLWRTDGWQTYVGEPSTVVVVNTHGYASGLQELQLGRGATLTICKIAYSNPSGAIREEIDDYAIAFQAAQDAMDASPNLAASLKAFYGRKGGLVRIG